MWASFTWIFSEFVLSNDLSANRSARILRTTEMRHMQAMRGKLRRQLGVEYSFNAAGTFHLFLLEP